MAKSFFLKKVGIKKKRGLYDIGLAKSFSDTDAFFQSFGLVLEKHACIDDISKVDIVGDVHKFHNAD